MIQGLSHITLITRDLDRMEEILVGVIGARKVYDSGEATFSLSKERFFLVGPEDTAVWIAIMEGDSLATRSYNHIAFKIAATEYERARERIAALGLELREGRSRVTGEGESLYFYDHDNHLFELHTGTLEERLRRYAEGR
ncbi:MAG: FosX/FosE/FosI family fosfomycin resistance hydrolase [Hyphomicrobiales bacterium]